MHTCMHSVVARLTPVTDGEIKFNDVIIYIFYIDCKIYQSNYTYLQDKFIKSNDVIYTHSYICSSASG
jgi:hypothetical protein